MTISLSRRDICLSALAASAVAWYGAYSGQVAASPEASAAVDHNFLKMRGARLGEYAIFQGSGAVFVEARPHQNWTVAETTTLAWAEGKAGLLEHRSRRLEFSTRSGVFEYAYHNVEVMGRSHAGHAVLQLAGIANLILTSRPVTANEAWAIADNETQGLLPSDIDQIYVYRYDPKTALRTTHMLERTYGLPELGISQGTPLIWRMEGRITSRTAAMESDAVDS